MSVIREILLRNWSLKLSSVLLALALWWVVRGESSAERIITVPLEIRVPRNMVIVNERPSTVEVTVRGVAGSNWFSQTAPICIIDLQGEGEGVHIVQLTEQNVRIPRTSGLEVIALRPMRLSVILERTISRDVPIRTVLGPPPEGFDVYSTSLAYPTVLLTGPRSRVDPIKEVQTETINLTGHEAPFTALGDIDVKDPLIHISPPGPVEVKIDLGVHRRLQNIASIPVVLNTKDWIATTRFVSATVLVPVSHTPELSAKDFAATVTVGNLDATQKTAKLRPEVKLLNINDPAIVIKEIRPVEVTVRRAERS